MVSLTAVVVRRGGRGAALVVAAMLALAAALALLAPKVGLVHTSDGSPTASATGALWVMVLPALLVAALAVVRPVAALAAGAGAGFVGASRFFADLAVIVTPEGVARPDLWVETTQHAFPVTPAAGAYLVLVADLVTLGAGFLAAGRLGSRLSYQRDSDFAGDTGGPPASRGSGAETEDFAGSGLAAPALEADPAFDRFDRMDRTVRRNNLMTAVGLLGALLLTVGALGVPYSGGYLSARYLPVSLGVAGLVGALVLAVIAATAVLVAGTLPRSLAVALLGGTALGGVVPLLVAVVVVATTPTHLTITVWIGLLGAILLTLAGFLARVRFVFAPTEARSAALDSGPSGDSGRSVRSLDLIAGGLALLSAGLAIAAFLLPPINAGGLERLLFLTDGSPVPGYTLFGAAALPLLAAGVITLLPVSVQIGRAATAISWSGLAFALTAAMQVLGDDGLSAARSIGLISLGAGTWCGFGAVAAGLVAAVVAAVAMGRASDASSFVDDDESVMEARAVTTPLAVGVAVLAVVASCLPMFATAGEIQSATILRWSSVDTWGVWALLVAVLGGLLAAVLTSRPPVVLGLLLAAAAVSAVRLVVPAHVSGASGFGLRPGYAVQGLLVVALVIAAAVMARSAGRIKRVPVQEYDAVFLDARRSGHAGSSSGRSSTSARSKGGKRR
jgi:hypothetical protein